MSHIPVVDRVDRLEVNTTLGLNNNVNPDNRNPVSSVVQRMLLNPGARPNGEPGAQGPGDQIRMEIRPLGPGDQVMMEMRPRRPPQPAYLVNQYSAAYGFNYKVNRAEQERLEGLLTRFEDAILAPTDNQLSLRVSCARKLVSYADNNGVKKFETFDELKLRFQGRPDIDMTALITEAEEFAEEITKVDLSGSRLNREGKGVTHGPAPFPRSNDMLKSLPRQDPEAYTINFAKPMAYARDLFNRTGANATASTDWLNRGNTLLTGIVTKIYDKIADKNGELIILGPNPSPQRTALEEELERLKNKKRYLEQQFDAAAFFLAAAFCPAVADINAANISIAQSRLITALTSDFEAKIEQQKGFRDKWPLSILFGKEPDRGPNRKYALYVADSMANMFASLAEMRNHSLDFHRENDLELAVDSLVDVALCSLRAGNAQKLEAALGIA